ncbi:MAG TPA: BMP family ABC transporter substrate-binding protein, partial [Candidatus Limnocylindrales bacterium]|nr:BMP family ABC transporter substrate-binding protein [Candidatus Limnocylindrales bacterium]
TLAELFDRRTGNELRLDDYHALGGLHGSLSRRSEEVFGQLDADGQTAARQVLLRLVRLGEGQRTAARRVPVRDLAALAIDPLVLSSVLRRFEANRLITFDRDPVSGGSTVEVAHEALLSGWSRLAAWIDQARSDLRFHDALATRTEEWAASGRRADDLLAGARLEELEAWAHETTFGLTLGERAYLEAGLERRRTEELERGARAARVRQLERRAWVRLLGFVGVAALLVAAIAYGITAWPGRAPEVVLVYPGPGDRGMHDSISAGFRNAVAELDLDAQTVVESPEALQERLRRLAEQGVRLIVVGSEMSNPDVELVARDHPETTFLASDYWGELPNVATPRFAVEEGSFLAGAAAAIESWTGMVGVVGEADSMPSWFYVAGFQAGAREADPGTEVIVSYLRDTVTFVKLNRAAEDLFRQGADVVYYTGTTAPLALFEAAWSESDALGRQLWAIGIDTNWYVALPIVSQPSGADADAWKSHVLTSMITRYDIAISAMLRDYVRGRLAPGEHYFGLADGAFELPESGGFLADSQPVIEDLRDRILAGEIEVPRFPPDRGPPR